MTESIHNFLNERKELWLKDRLKKAENETQIAELNLQANEKFSLKEWLPDAAKRVTQLSMVSHPSKFSHPSAKTSSVIAQAKFANDGYWRSGNVDYPLDVFGNAAAMDVYKFLSLPLTDDNSVLDGFEKEDKNLQYLLERAALDFQAFKHAFLVIKQGDESKKTDHLIKQVYFPIVDNGYHLLSILTPSGLITKLKQNIDQSRFSDATKLAKERRKKNEHDEIGYADIFDLTVTAYGGTQPQNVSVLNSQNAGRAYLLSSCPPVFEKRHVRLPSRDFFSQCLYLKQFRNDFDSLKKLVGASSQESEQIAKNNSFIRKKIKREIQGIVQGILFIAFCIRRNHQAWSEMENYKNLPLEQKIWLDDANTEQRDVNDEWRSEIARRIAKWILESFEKVIDAKLFGTPEIIEVKEIVLEALEVDKEFF